MMATSEMNRVTGNILMKRLGKGIYQDIDQC